MTDTELALKDRVRRKAKRRIEGSGAEVEYQVSGSIGTVSEIRTEITNTGSEEKGLMIRVDWDDGTQSFSTPASLERV